MVVKEKRISYTNEFSCRYPLPLGIVVDDLHSQRAQSQSHSLSLSKIQHYKHLFDCSPSRTYDN